MGRLPARPAAWGYGLWVNCSSILSVAARTSSAWRAISASSAAILDGFELNRQGKGGFALTLDLLCSSIGGLIGVTVLILVAPPLARIALRFSSAEYFWLGLFGLSMSAVVSKGNTFRGIIAAALGLLVSTVGMDVTTGHPRFTF